MDQLYKYELNAAVVNYLINAVNAQQIRGEQQAQDLMVILQTLRNPKNSEELEKEQMESLKQKYEPITTKEEKKK